MWRRRRAPALPPDAAGALEGFRETVRLVEESKAALASAAPSGRAAGTPLAEALARFEGGLAEAGRAMAGWNALAVEAEWQACRAALDESSRRAERFRLEAVPEGYEELYGALGDLMEPLDAFRGALEAFRRLGR